MRPDRGMSGSMERPTGGDGESRPEQDVSRTSATNEEQKMEAAAVRHNQKLPRQCEAPSRTASPAMAAPALSRQSSSMSTAASPADVCSTKSPEPPVTKATLSELDVSKIINNPKLRHDINFDPDLHFRPNMDGEKGKRKQEKADVFWQSLRSDLTMFLTDRQRFDQEHGNDTKWTLPALLSAAKEIIQTLVPSRDRAVLDEGLNVDLFMQQFYRGVADLEKLSSWLRSVLKLHCAPMRDEWVDTVYRQLSNGNANNDLDELVRGMKNLLTVLEAMKLDVANHQIRCLRPALIEDTVGFEQKFFHRRMASGRMRPTAFKQWYEQAREQFCDDTLHPSQDFGDMGVFFETVAWSLMPKQINTPMPATFQFDDERVSRLRNDVFDAVFVEGCLRQFEKMESTCQAFNFSSLKASSRPASHAGSDSVSPLGIPMFSSRPSSQAFSTTSSDASPRSSMLLPSPSSVPSYLQQSEPDIVSRRTNLHKALIDILQSAAPNTCQLERWRAIAPAMALEVFRATGLPMRHFSELEDIIVNKMLDTDSDDFAELQQDMFERLMRVLRDRVRRYRGLSGNALFTTATGELHMGLFEAAGASGLEDIATKLAHVGIVHWRVWAQPVYLDTEMSG